MKTFQLWPDWLLGSTAMFEPYQTASARPGPPALIHGKTLTREGGRLTCTGVLQRRQPLAVLAALTNTCQSPGPGELPGLCTSQHTWRLRAASMERTVNRVSGDARR